MKKQFVPIMLLAATLSACSGGDQATSEPMITKTEIQVENGQFTPEIMHRLGKVGDPQLSPDYSKILYGVTYTSIEQNKGNRELYLMNADGSDVHRISFGAGRYATPVWSPRGDYIAFTKMANGQFYIGVMYPDGSGERLLASGYLVEGPTWSPNGRVVIFFRQDRGTSRSNAPVKLYSIDLTGYNERMIVTPADASDPAWSPLLP